MSGSTAARIAFVGAGNHSTESLYPNLAHIPEFDLVAVCDLDASKAARAAKVYGAPAHYTDLSAMLAQVQPQGVCVCGRPEMHHEVGLQVLSQGIPLFTEKPPALTAAAAEELVRTAEGNATFGMVAFMKRFAPANLVARETLGTERFGALNSLSMIHGSGPYDDIRRMLLFNAIHLLDLARFFAGDVTEVFAYRSPEGSAVQAVCLCLQFAGGVVGQFNMNSSVTWQDCFEQVYLSGDGAALLIDGSREAELMSARQRFAEPADVRLAGFSSRYYVSGNLSGWASGGHYTRGYHGELQQFARAVLGQAEPTPSLLDGLRALQLIEAIMQSLQTRQPVALTNA